MLLSEAVALRLGARARLCDVTCVFDVYCGAMHCSHVRLCSQEGEAQLGKPAWPLLWQALCDGRWRGHADQMLLIPLERISMRQVALDLFEATWEEMIGTPSCQSVDEETPVRSHPA